MENEGRKRISILSYLGAFIACVLLILALFLWVMLYTAQTSFTEENIRSAVEDALSAGLDSEAVYDNVGSGMVTEMLRDNLGEELMEQYNFSGDNVEKILQDEDIKGFVSGKITDVFTYMYSGGDEEAPQVTSREIVDLLEKKEDTIYAITGYRMEEKDYQTIEDALGREQENLMPEVETGPDNILVWVKNIVESNLLAVLTAVCLVLGGLVFLFYYKRISNALRGVGISFLCAGGLTFWVSRLLGTVPELLNEQEGLPQEAISALFAPFLSNLSQAMWVILCTGIICIAGCLLLRMQEREEVSAAL